MEENVNKIDVVNVRLVEEPALYSETEIHSSEDILNLMGKELSKYDREIFCILNLRSNGSVINMNVVSMGSLNQSLISPREVFKSSILSNAAYLIALHNHPSGSVKPSRSDYDTTKRLYDCGRILDMPLVDHIIVGDRPERQYSFAEHGVLGKSYKEVQMEKDSFER